LEEKGWKKEKIRENLEAEIIDVILCESVEVHSEAHVFEIDTTTATVEEIVENIDGWYKTGFSLPTSYKVGHIDWSDFLSEDFIRGV
ncbi:MAG: NMP kinase, partial [Candidatus Thermoplasmatota archaeon]|nr:NMP kinase [Candidatus Thermoplasmatota archaeon]